MFNPYNNQNPYYIEYDVQRYIYEKTVNTGVSKAYDNCTLTYDLNYMGELFLLYYYNICDNSPITCKFYSIPNVCDSVIKFLSTHNKNFIFHEEESEYVYNYFKNTNIAKYPFVIFDDDTKRMYTAQYAIYTEESVNNVIGFINDITKHITILEGKFKSKRFLNKIGNKK